MHFVDFSELTLECKQPGSNDFTTTSKLKPNELYDSDEDLDQSSSNQPFVFSEALKEKLSEDVISMVLLKTSTATPPPPEPPSSWALVPYVSPDEKFLKLFNKDDNQGSGSNSQHVSNAIATSPITSSETVSEEAGSSQPKPTDSAYSSNDEADELELVESLTEGLEKMECC